MIAGLERGHARADLAHDAGALMAEDRREQPFGIGARERVGVGVADARRLDLDQDLAGPRAVELDGLDRQRLAGLEGDGGAGLHRNTFRRSMSLLSLSSFGGPRPAQIAPFGFKDRGAARRLPGGCQEARVA